MTSVSPGIDRLVHHQVTVTGLSLPEIVAADSVKEATPAESQAEVVSRAAFVAPQAASASATLPFTGAGVPAGAATAVDSTFGNQTVAVLLLKFAGATTSLPAGYNQQSFWNGVWNGPATPNVNEYTKEVSYNQTSVSTDVYGPITIPGDYTCNTVDAMANAALSTAIAGGLDVSKYNHFAYIFATPTCNFGGLGSNGPQTATALIPHQYTNLWSYVGPTQEVTAAGSDFLWYAASQHEFGHNLGMNHSNSLDFGALALGPLDFASVNPGTVNPADGTQTTATAPVVAGQIAAVNSEYGDNFAGMGDPQGPYTAAHRTEVLGWIPSSGTQDVTASGSFTLNPAEVNTGLRSLHILRDPASSSWIWVEFHQPIGIYTPRSEAHDPLVSNPNTLYTGAQLHYQNGLAPGDLHTLLLDMAPISQPNNFYNSNLAPGASWSDPYSLLTITAGKQTTSSLGITVSYDAPCATVALDTTKIPAAGASGTVTITAPASCKWSVSSNVAWISFSGATTGTGNAKVKFAAAANTASTQRNTYITAQRQSLPLVQLGTAVTILPSTAFSAPAGKFVPLVFNVTDGLGIKDLSEFDITIRGGTSPSCVINALAGSSDNADPPTYVNANLSFFNNGVSPDALPTGTPGTIADAACTLDVGASSWTVDGKNGTLTLMVMFPAGYVGVHSIDAIAYGSTDGTQIPLSYVNVTAAGTTKQSAAISPATSSTGATVPFTIIGQSTNFTPASTVQVSGGGVSVKSLSFVDAHTLSGQMAVSPTAATGARTVTVTSEKETVATAFTVAAATPTITISPSSGKLGTKVPITITGTATNFTAETTVKVSGTRVAANQVKYVSPTSLTATIAINDDADSDQRTVTVSTGSEVETAPFTVIPEDIPHIAFSPATGNQGDFAVVTITGDNTHFTDATKITIPGTDINVTNVQVLNGTAISAKFIMTASATAGARVVTITTGTEVVKGTFTVTAIADTTTTIAAAAASVEQTVPAMLTVTVAPKTGTGVPTGYVSIIEKGEANGLEDIVGTLLLSGGKATLPVAHLTVGNHSFSAQYLGNNVSFAQSQSTADAKVTVTADPGKAELTTTATLQMLADGRYEAIVTLANSGKGTAKKVVMTASTLGGAASASALPAALQDIAPGGSITALFDFLTGAGTPGSGSVLKFSGTYAGGTFSASSRVTLPTAPATN